MNDLFKKLNTLVKASINDLLGEEVTSSRRKSIDLAKLGKDMDREIAALRQRINDAVAYENTLQQKAASLVDEVNRWDQQADEAVASGNDAGARYAIDQMQRAQQRLTMAESDLREHRLVTQELIQRVNTLEATVADARRQQLAEEKAETQAAPEETALPGRGLSDVLREAREKITRMGDLLTTKDEIAKPDPKLDEPPDEQAIDDDLAVRRQRLSKPK